MSRPADGMAVLDLEPATSEFLAQAIAGLTSDPPTLPPKFFYDERGSDLFQEICELPEYYVTRTERSILQQYAGEMAESIGERAELVGFGTGAGTKTRMLLEKLKHPIAYVPVDISKQRLIESADALQRDMPQLEVLPVCADYLQPIRLPTPSQAPDHIAVFFPGSTIGNMVPDVARDFLKRICKLSGRSGGLIIGVDLQKPRSILEMAYNDSAGVTAEFNLNLLVRANRELGADFDLSRWNHRAVYNEQANRIEMHLVAEGEQHVHLGGRTFVFHDGESIITEFSYKHTEDGFIKLAESAGFRLSRFWSDAQRFFGVFHFVTGA